MDKLLVTLASFHLRPPVTDEEDMRLILDPSDVYYGQRQLEAVTGDYCFTLSWDTPLDTLLQVARITSSTVHLISQMGIIQEEEGWH